MEDSKRKSPKTLFARNKKKSSKFSSSEDARTSRAVQRKVEQKNRRTLSLAQHRSVSTPHQNDEEVEEVQEKKNFEFLFEKLPPKEMSKVQLRTAWPAAQAILIASNSSLTPLARTNCKLYSKSITSTTKKYSKNELDTLGRVRYQDMLQWKKERNKLIEIEKKKRKPTFMSGIYKPEAPKFLTSKDDQSSVRGATPFMSSSKQKIKYDSISKSMLACESKACKPLEFGTGKTPLEAKELKRGRILRSSIPVLPHLISFGITPLPLTPPTISDQQKFSKGLSKPTESFAPNLFRFEVPAGLKSYDFSSNKKAVQLVCPAIFEDVEEKPETHCTDFDISTGETSATEVSTEAQQTVEVPVKTQQTSEVTIDTQPAVGVSIDTQQAQEDPAETIYSVELPISSHQTVDVPVETHLTVNVPTETYHIIEAPLESHDVVEVPMETQYELGNATGVKSNVVDTLSNSILCKQDRFKLSIDNKMEEPSNIEGEDRSGKDYEIKLSTDSTQQVCEPVIRVCFELKTDCSNEDNNNSGCILGEMSLKLSDSSDTDADDFYFPLCEASKLVENAGQTPAPTTGRRTRYSIAAIKEKDAKNDFSPTSRLRPRTPCSRSTRRSHSAHCDHFSLESLVTPNNRSTKKERQSSLRKSFNNITNNKVSKLNMATPIITITPDLKNVNDIIIPSLKFNASSDDTNNFTPFKTPLSHIVKKTPGCRFRVSSLVDTSPWINKSRGSSSSKGKQRRSIFSNELESMFNDLPLDGSLPASLLNEIGMSASPIFNQSTNATNSSQIVAPDDPNYSFKENMTPELKEFLQPSTSSMFQEKYKPDVLVWTPESAESSPAFPSKADYSHLERYENDSNLLPVPTLAEENVQRQPLSEISVSGNVSKRRRRTRHASVTFADNSSLSEKTGCKFPTTPVARSSRVSLGLFSEVREDEELRQPVKLGENLIQLDSPIVLAGSRRKSQFRGSHRISLLPGLEPCSEKEENENKVPIEGDLMSFDTPTDTTLKTTNKLLSKLDAGTPLRRSRRISHVLPP